LIFNGPQDIYVRPFPEVNNSIWKISGIERNGINPVWSSDGKKLIYFSPPLDFYAVDVNTEQVFTHGTPEPEISVIRGLSFNELQRKFDVHPDDNSFLIISSVNLNIDTGIKSDFMVIENFFEEVKRLAPVKKE